MDDLGVPLFLETSIYAIQFFTMLMWSVGSLFPSPSCSRVQRTQDARQLSRRGETQMCNEKKLDV